MQSTPDKVYIDKLASTIFAVEKSIGSEVEFINHPINGSIGVKFTNGNSYQFFNYRDPLRDKPKRVGYKPPKIEFKKLAVEIKEDVPESEFGIFRFCIYVLLFAVAALDVILCWFIITQFPNR